MKLLLIFYCYKQFSEKANTFSFIHISFKQINILRSLNVIINVYIYLDNLDEYSAELPAPVRNVGDVTAVQSSGQLSGVGNEKGKGSIQSITNNGALAGSEFAYTTPCLVKGRLNFVVRASKTAFS